MLPKSNMICLLVAAFFLYSCGTSKKLETAQLRIDDLQAQNSQQLNDINILKKQVADLTGRNSAMTQEFDQYKTKCEATEERLARLRRALREEEENFERVEEKLSAGLADFESRGVDVYSKDGVIYVSMEDDLLYKSGSAKLGEDGKKALEALALVLNDYPDLKVIVVGNTDNVQFKKGSDNWTLSTERANGVVRLLRDSYNVKPERLTAAGKGKYNPVADNGTEEGRAKNRRTDIVLNPDFRKAWNSAKLE